MNIAEAHKYALGKGLNISRQGLYSAALTYAFAQADEEGNLTYDKDGVDEYVKYKTDTHPEYKRLYFEKYTATSTTILAILLKAGVKYHRYGMNFIISRKDVKDVEKILRSYRRDD